MAIIEGPIVRFDRGKNFNANPSSIEDDKDGRLLFDIETRTIYLDTVEKFDPSQDRGPVMRVPFYCTDTNTTYTGTNSITINSDNKIFARLKPSGGLAIDSEGLYVNKVYTLPTAASTVLGGVKVGNCLTINSSGVLSVNPDGKTIINNDNELTTRIVERKYTYVPEIEQDEVVITPNYYFRTYCGPELPNKTNFIPDGEHENKFMTPAGIRKAINGSEYPESIYQNKFMTECVASLLPVGPPYASYNYTPTTTSQQYEIPLFVAANKCVSNGSTAGVITKASTKTAYTLHINGKYIMSAHTIITVHSAVKCIRLRLYTKAGNNSQTLIKEVRQGVNYDAYTIYDLSLPPFVVDIRNAEVDVIPYVYVEVDENITDLSKRGVIIDQENSYMTVQLLSETI